MKTIALGLGLAAVLAIYGCGDNEESDPGTGGTAGAAGASGGKAGASAGGGGSTANGGSQSGGNQSGGAGGSVDGGGSSAGSGAGGSPLGPCADSADCAGRTCCTTGSGEPSCVDAPDDCTGLVLCSLPSECANGDPCCPQGFCGGCD